ncbi:MAG: hypothetical protein O7B81_06725 [Gammaproteobacteria bacterium]|nr:hypothetical protein [Gammaproteobacteria bacterium]
MIEHDEHLPQGAPWLTEKKALLRDAYRFQTVVDSAKWSRPFLREEDVPQRKGERPITYDDAPHQMYTQQARPAVLEKLIGAALELSKKLGTVVSPTLVSFNTSKPAFFLPKSIPLPDGLLEYNREHAHIHAIWTSEQKPGPDTEGTGGGSMHVSVSHTDAQLLITRGWAEWHPYAAENFPHILIYAPQNEDQIDVSLAVLVASYKFITDATV